jgi:hypothetical protein
MKEIKDINFETLLYVIDTVNSNSDIMSYDMNYDYNSKEIDAMAQAFVDTKTFLEKYPQYTSFLIPTQSNTGNLNNYFRISNAEGIKKISSSIKLFEDNFNKQLDKINSSDTTFKEEKIDAYLHYYPVVLQFYDYDKEKNRIIRKSDEYFKDKLRQLEQEPESLSKREQIYSIKSFMYSSKIESYIINHENDGSLNVDDNNNMIINVEEVINEVGPVPGK